MLNSPTDGITKEVLHNEIPHRQPHGLVAECTPPLSHYLVDPANLQQTAL